MHNSQPIEKMTFKNMCLPFTPSCISYPFEVGFF